jgi:cyclopropane-fatty-acyl-phospholipid synthase
VGRQEPWDIQVHHLATFDRILTRGSLGLGESYMDGWWDCGAVDEFITRVLRAIKNFLKALKPTVRANLAKRI